MGKLVRVNDKTYIREDDIVSITAEYDAKGDVCYNAHTASQSLYIDSECLPRVFSTLVEKADGALQWFIIKLLDMGFTINLTRHHDVTFCVITRLEACDGYGTHEHLYYNGTMSFDRTDLPMQSVMKILDSPDRVELLHKNNRNRGL